MPISSLEAPQYRDAAFDEANADLVGVVLPDDGGRVAGGAGGKVALVQQDYVGHAELSQVVECAGPDGAAADDNRVSRFLHGTLRSAVR